MIRVEEALRIVSETVYIPKYCKKSEGGEKKITEM